MGFYCEESTVTRYREQEELSLGVVQVKKAKKYIFFDDFDGCPSKGVWYQGRKHEFVSWVPKKNIAMRPAPPLHPVRDWVGLWSDGIATIRISASNADDSLEILSKLV